MSVLTAVGSASLELFKTREGQLKKNIVAATRTAYCTEKCAKDPISASSPPSNLRSNPLFQPGLGEVQFSTQRMRSQISHQDVSPFSTEGPKLFLIEERCLPLSPKLSPELSPMEAKPRKAAGMVALPRLHRYKFLPNGHFLFRPLQYMGATINGLCDVIVHDIQTES